jgi:transcriptional regulator with XRE-family HTH domain
MKNLDYKEVARLFNYGNKKKVSVTTVFRWLNGSRRPTPENAKRLEKIIGVPVLAWLYPNEYKNPFFKK